MAVSKVAKEKKFVRKKAEVVQSFDESLDEFDPSDFVKAARAHTKRVFVPDSEADALIQVNDWIKMPAPIRDALGGLPGLPCGLITMIYGKKDCGKTTAATEALRSAQADGGIAVLIDTENKYNLKRAAAMGLNVRKLIILQAVTIEEVFDSLVSIITTVRSRPDWSKRKIVVVWDSLGGTPSDSEMDDSKGEFAMTAARIIKGGLRKTVRIIKDMKVAFVIINHVYTKAGVTFGKKTTTYGGEGPEYYSALMLEFVRTGRIRPTGVKAPEPFCGIKSIVSCEKNHLGQPFRESEVEIDWRGFVVERSAEYAPEGFFYEEKKEEKENEQSLA